MRKLFWPILSFFETEEEPVNYKPSHRVILIVVGLLFLFLSLVSMWFAYSTGEAGAAIPVLVFLGVATVAIVVGSLGTDNAVSKIWGRR